MTVHIVSHNASYSTCVYVCSFNKTPGLTSLLKLHYCNCVLWKLQLSYCILDALVRSYTNYRWMKKAEKQCLKHILGIQFKGAHDRKELVKYVKMNKIGLGAGVISSSQCSSVQQNVMKRQRTWVKSDKTFKVMVIFD